MAQTPVPHRFTGEISWEQARPLIDDNFDKVIQNTYDMGARISSSKTLTFSSVTTGSTFRETIVLVNPSKTSSYSYINLAQPENGFTAAVPIIDVYVDTNSSAFLWPNGSSLTTAQRNLIIGVKKDLTAADGIASFTISGRNNDSSTHTYYVTFKVAYFPSPPTGIYR